MAPSAVDGYNAQVRSAAALAVALGLVFVTSAAAAPRPHVERARAGAVQASFSYAYDAAKFRFTKQRLAIRRSGQTRFADDLVFPRMLHCKLLRSRYPHALLKSVDVSRALSAPGLRACDSVRARGDLPVPRRRRWSG